MNTASKEKLVAVLQNENVRLWNRYVRWCRRHDPGWRADLSFADMPGADLYEANLSEANLYVADLHGADLSGADLRNADLSGADLRGADLSGADLSGADLRNADLSGSNLDGADLRRANLRGADLRGADLRGADLHGADMDFSCWPLCCGGTMAKIDRRISLQLIYHAFNQDHLDNDVREALEHLRPLAQEFVDTHRQDAPKLRER